MDYKIDSLITRGMMHELRCEDDYMIFDNDEIIISAVFDGCSSGIDSHYASTFLRKKLNEYLEDNSIYIIREDENRNFPYKSCDETLKGILEYLHSCIPYSETEYLSTCVMCYINKETYEYSILFAGDGECCIDGKRHIVHDKEGNAVRYLSTVKTYSDFNEYYDKYCKKYSGIFNESLIISTDGIGSFIDKFNADKSELARSLFYGEGEIKIDERFMKLPLKRQYNILSNGRIFKENEKIPVKNLDDFTIIKIMSV